MSTENNYVTKIYLKVFLLWQDEDEEKWLETMSAKGWQLVSVIPFFYTFQKVSSKHIVIRLDYKNSWDKDYQEYLSVFSDAGWSLLTKLGNWHYFSINPQNGSVPEIYNSNRAKAHKYRRILIGLAPLLLLFFGQLPRALHSDSQTIDSGLDIVIKGLCLFTSMLFLYSFLRVCIKLIQLNTNNKE